MTTTTTKRGRPKGSGNPEKQARLGSWRWRRDQKQKSLGTFQLPRLELPDLTEEMVESYCRSAIPGYDPWATAGDGHWFDSEGAYEVVTWMHTNLRHHTGPKATHPFILEPWQIAIVGNVFGWLRADGLRRYREVLLYVPKKMGKTPLCAAILIVLLFPMCKHGAQLYGAASTYGLASLVWDWVRGMILLSPGLERQCDIKKGQEKAVSRHRDKGFATYKVISGEKAGAHGFNITAGIVDELHTHDDPDLVNFLIGGTAAADEPLLMYATTADYDRESICNEKYKYASDVRDKHISDPSFLPVLYEAALTDDWTDPVVWSKAAPNLDVSVKREFYEREVERAKRSPVYENVFKRMHLNIKTQQDVKFLDMGEWEACGGALPDLAGCRAFAGVDLGSTADFCSAALWFPEHKAVLARHWIPRDALTNRGHRDQRNRMAYEKWEAMGLITVTEGNVRDTRQIKADILEWFSGFEIVDVAFDPWRATDLQLELAEEGLTVVTFGQGFASMAAPTEELERRVLSREIYHGGDPVLRWMASNTSVRTDPAGNMKPDKDKSSDKIDGIVALVMALGRSMVSKGTKRSVYEERGVIDL